jgi:hypothetical protein
MTSPSVAARVVVLALLGALGAPGAARASTTTTTGATSSTTLPHPPRCSALGARCGTCGPAGQCLKHVDQGPPSRVCVNGGFCVQVGCGADAACSPRQVCATLGDINACCTTCR